MLATDENALVCDLAETYGIYNYRSLPVSLVATFSNGLRDDSRIKMKMSGERVSNRDILLSVIADRIGMLINGITGKELIKDSLEERIRGIDKNKNTDSDNQEFETFSSAEDFDAWREKFLEDWRQKNNE